MSKNETEEFNPLALDNQLCFALYVCSKEIIRKYNPLLEPLGITYTAYITLLCLWEKDNVTVKELGSRLFLDSGTLTPLLKKMEGQGLLTRTRGGKDERTGFHAREGDDQIDDHHQRQPLDHLNGLGFAQLQDDTVGDQGHQGQQQHDGHAAQHPAVAQAPDPEEAETLPDRHQKPHL